ncbi:MAG: PEP-CTERM sorting domain-containing protein [Pirellulales bacterium]
MKRCSDSKPSRNWRAAILAKSAIGLVTMISGVVHANPWNPTTSAVPGPSILIPKPSEVPGKDFSDIRDRNAAGAPDPEQVVSWDGKGGVRDSFDYDEPPNTRPLYPTSTQVDGLAAGADALFHEVVDNKAALLFSLETDANVMFERATGFPAAPAGFGIWATAQDIDAMNPPIDTDALELWGGDDADDSNRYSLAGDPFVQVAGAALKVAVWEYDEPGKTSLPHTFTTDLAAAMDLQAGGPGKGGPLWGLLVEQMDVDAIMIFGKEVLFSIRPLQVPGTPLAFDGGEVFVYKNATTPAKYLDHGGHLWDTAFDVKGTFGVANENVDALEAAATFVPEPATCALAALGLLGVSGLVGRRRRA